MKPPPYVDQEEYEAEYTVLLLEGHTPEEAHDRAVWAQRRFYREHLEFDENSWRFERGQPAAVDARDDETREADWDFTDTYSPLFHEYRRRLTSRQSKVLAMRLGLDGYDPSMPAIIAARLGLKPRQVTDALWNARSRIREMWVDEHPDDVPAHELERREQRLARQRQLSAQRERPLAEAPQTNVGSSPELATTRVAHLLTDIKLVQLEEAVRHPI